MNTGVIISFFLFTLLPAGIAVYKTRKQKKNTSVDFFLGSRSLGFWMIGSSLLLTNLSANQFIGENEFVYTTNMSVMAWGMSSVLAMLLVAEFLMPVYLKIGAITTVDFLEKRFDSQTKKMVSVVFLLSYLVNLVPAVLYGSAVAINGIFHIDAHFGLSYFSAIRLLVLLVGAVGGMYVLLGGLKAITVSDVVQGAGMLAGGLLLCWFAFSKLGDGDVWTGVYKTATENKSHLNAIGGPHDPLPFSTLFTGMLLINIYYWGMEQYIVQQALASKSLAASQKGISLACVGKLISPLLLNIPGLIALQLYPGIKNTATVFPALVGDVLPPLLAGFIAAVIFGAALSTFNAGMNSLGTLFVMNFYMPWAKRNIVSDDIERRALRTGKKFQFLVIVLAICCSPYIMFFKGGFYDFLQRATSFFSVPVFTVMAVGLITKRVPAIAAKTGLFFFTGVYFLTQFVFDTGMHYLHVLAVLFVVTMVLMMAIGKVKPLAAPFVLPLAGAVDIQPWKQRHWYFGILIILMILVFVLFSPLGLAS